MRQQLTDFLIENGVWGLMFVSFADSSFFPVPPDFILVPLAIARPEMALWYGVLTTATSVLGAILGWWIGLKAGRPLLHTMFSAEKIEKVEVYYQKYGGPAIAVAGFTPLPYKLFTITAGMSNISLNTLIWWSLLSRGARFMLEAAIILYLGEAAQMFIKQYFGTITFVVVGCLIISYIGFRLYKSHSASLNR